MASLYSALSADHHLMLPVRQSRLDFICAAAGSPPARLLDAGSSAGQYVAAVSAHGYETFGVEINSDLHRMAVRLHPQLAHRLIHGDLLEVFDLVRGPVDLAFCTGGTLSELSSDEQVRDVLSQLWDLTSPQGTVVIEVPCVEHLLSEARRTERLLAGDPGGIAALLETEPAAVSPEAGSLTEEGVSLAWPRMSATRADGLRVTLEHTLSLPPGGAPRPEFLAATWRHVAGDDVTVIEQTLLALSRERLESCLPEAARATWYGGYSSEPWGETQPLTVVALQR